MCLICDEKPKVKRTKKEMTFYKILGVCRTGELITPYQLRHTELGAMNVDADLKDFYTVKASGTLDPTYGICAGGFHLMTNKRQAQKELNWLNAVCTSSSVPQYRIYKAVVPEGTAYVEGYWDDGIKSVVVKKVRYEKL